MCLKRGVDMLKKTTNKPQPLLFFLFLRAVSVTLSVIFFFWVQMDRVACAVSQSGGSSFSSLIVSFLAVLSALLFENFTLSTSTSTTSEPADEILLSFAMPWWCLVSRLFACFSPFRHVLDEI